MAASRLTSFSEENITQLFNDKESSSLNRGFTVRREISDHNKNITFAI